MPKEAVTQILARNLSAAMQARKLSQPALADMSGVPQTTISLMLRPNARFPTQGKASPSPTIERVAMIAHALKLDPWQLLHPHPEQAQRETAFYRQIKKNFETLPHKTSPESAISGR